MKRLSLSVIISCVLLATPLFSAELSPELREKADHALQSLDDTIMRINSGICHITGKTIMPEGDVIDDDIMIAFDYGANCYRFENGDLKRTLLTPEYFYEVEDLNTDRVSVRRRSASDPQSRSWPCHHIDVRNIFRYVPLGPYKPNDYQESEFHLQNKEIIKVGYEELADGLIKVTTVTPPTASFTEYREYFLDKNNGYTVRQIKRSVGYSYELSWEKINQTWVPVSYVFDSGTRYGIFGVEWKIDWEQVNEKVDETFFDLEEMLADQEHDAYMYSEELGSPATFVGKVGNNEDWARKPLPETASPSKNVSFFRYFLVAAGLTMILLALGKKFYDKKTKTFS
jgi:hypothetical protein